MAPTEFLATIDSRERKLMEAIFAGDDAPFPDPVERADAAAGAGSPDASPSRRGRRPGEG